ncbi:RAD51-associated protein 1-like isoform X2 [Antennarius striatus]|uniref:RAD51-associated protein 1-like isoform X2 n=1 Tax=Antennarius striatus TaxID=241820 RepID=UPI0035B2DCE4
MHVYAHQQTRTSTVIVFLRLKILAKYRRLTSNGPTVEVCGGLFIHSFISVSLLLDLHTLFCRSRRKTKVVNYSEDKDFDDDDFASVKVPPSKKSRDSVKLENKNSSNKSSSQESNSESAASQKSRRPLDERLHERDLEAAIMLSMLSNEDSKKDQCLTSKGEITVQGPVDENTDPTSLCRSNCSVDIEAFGLDGITPEKELLAVPKQRKAKEEIKKLTNEDEDYEPKLTPDSESDDDFSEPTESEDEEFTVSKSSKTKKKDKATKKERNKPAPASKKEKSVSKPSKPKLQAAASKPLKSSPSSKPASKRPIPSSTVSVSKPALSPGPAGSRIPKWTPPGQIGRSPTSSLSPAVRSPGQGLRLGLSRRVRVKPLHPGVTSH